MTRSDQAPLETLKSMREMESRLEEFDEQVRPFIISVLDQYFGQGTISYKQKEAVLRIYGDHVKEGIQLDGDLAATFLMLRMAGEHLERPKMQFRVDDSEHDLAFIFNKEINQPAWVTNAYSRQSYQHFTYGKLLPTGEFKVRNGASRRPEWPAVLEFVNLLARDPLQAARMSAARVGRCSFCWKELTDPESKSHGYGPVCAKHFQLPWGKYDNKPVDVDGLLAELDKPTFSTTNPVLFNAIKEAQS